MNAVKHSYEDEARLLDAEVAELRAKQRQANLYIVELRKRFEENMRSIYRCDGLPVFFCLLAAVYMTCYDAHPLLFFVVVPRICNL